MAGTTVSPSAAVVVVKVTPPTSPGTVKVVWSPAEPVTVVVSVVGVLAASVEAVTSKVKLHVPVSPSPSTSVPPTS